MFDFNMMTVFAREVATNDIIMISEAIDTLLSYKSYHYNLYKCSVNC